MALGTFNGLTLAEFQESIPNSAENDVFYIVNDSDSTIDVDIRTGATVSAAMTIGREDEAALAEGSTTRVAIDKKSYFRLFRVTNSATTGTSAIFVSGRGRHTANTTDGDVVLAIFEDATP